MNEEKQLEILQKAAEKGLEDSFPEYALKLINGDEMSDSDKERCQRYCEGIAEAVLSGPARMSGHSS